MKLYLLTQNSNRGYDTYDSCVVCAHSAEDAATISPDSYGDDFPNFKPNSSTWAKQIQDIEVTELGIAHDNIKRGVICSSFNAG